MKRKLYRQIASLIDARLRCEKTGNVVWHREHEKRLDEIAMNCLPHGSGIDNGTTIDLDKSTGEKIVINSSYHTMDENGYYGPWIDFTVTVTPSLISECRLNISGRFGQDQDLKDHLCDVFDDCLNQDEMP